MTKSDIKRSQRTAYHESGDAVASYLMEKRFNEVSIIPDNDSLGRLAGNKWQSKFNPGDDSSQKGRTQVEATIIIYLAGVIAEKELL